MSEVVETGHIEEEMHEYILTYARVVIFKRHLFAEDRKHAQTLALDLEHNGELGFADFVSSSVEAMPESEIDDVQDYDVIWEVERVSEW